MDNFTNLPTLRTDLPVLILYNVDPAWPEEDIRSVHTLADMTAAELSQLGHPLKVVALADARLEDALASFDPQGYIVFNWCESLPGLPDGEGHVARWLERRGFTFTGARARALKADKRDIKRLLIRQGVPTPPWTVYDSPSIDGWHCFPAIVKPIREHCSAGIDSEAVVTNRKHLAERVERMMCTYQQPVLIEEFISGRELTVSLIGNETLHMLPVVEIDFSNIANDLDRIRTCDSKFQKNSPAYQNIKTVLPAMLQPGEQQRLNTVTCTAFRAARCRDYVRIDLRLRDGVFYVVDVNHNADLSPDSSLSLSAQAAGLHHGQLISLLVNLAARRHPVYRYPVTGYT